MTKKNFMALADALRKTDPNIDSPEKVHHQWFKDVKAIADAIEASNPRFERDRWISYVFKTGEYAERH